MSTHPLRKTHIKKVVEDVYGRIQNQVSFEYPHDFTLAQQGITTAGSVKESFKNYYRQTLRFVGINKQGKQTFKSFIN